ncbi:MAG: MFS transporter [Sphingomonadaceae bacterium]|nr:MFS transporter [Sphingomonadaceae bacterium]
MDRAPHPLSIHNFRAFWAARLMMNLAQYSMMLLIGWQTYNIARETMDTGAAAAQLGLIGLLQFLPLFFLTPVSGWVADRMNRRAVGMATVALQLACALVLAGFTWRGAMDLPVLFTIAVFLGVARAFNGPALGALAPNLVPPAVLPNAIALSSISWQAGMVAGPALGALVYARAPAGAYLVSVGLFALALLCLATIGKVPRSAIPGAQHPIAQMVDGVRYVFRNRMVLGAITLDLFAVLLAGSTALLPVFARDILHVGAQGLGWLAAAPASGAVVTALYFSFRPLKTNVGPKMLGAVALFGVAAIGFGLSRSLPLSIACLFVGGAADMFSVYIRQSLIQLHTPDPMRGRVSAASLLTISASNELGEAESGFLAALIGPVAAVIAGGVGAIAVVLLWSRWFPELRRARTFDPPEAARRSELPEQTMQEKLS